MLINCKECGLQVSDKASSCPHCGLPMKGVSVTKPKKRKSKYRRLPNGFGQIARINGNLRKPFRVQVNKGLSVTGHYRIKSLGYYETYEDAYEALLEYHKKPYDLDKKMTVEELYKKWSEKYFETLTNDGSVRSIEACWRYCTSVYDLRIDEIRPRHIKYCMYEGESTVKGVTKKASLNIQSRIKSMFNLMFDYAVEFELLDRNPARDFEISKTVIRERDAKAIHHITFTEEELSALWNNIEIPYMDMILVQCYTGLRPGELVNLRQSEICPEDGVIRTAGSKTMAGKNRVIPIHPRIKDLLADRMKNKREWLYYDKDNTHMTYDRYRHKYDSIVSDLRLNPSHKAHDPRKTFITMAKKYKVDEYALKRIVGHAVNDITEAIYTDRDDKWLIEEIHKIP